MDGARLARRAVAVAVLFLQFRDRMMTSERVRMPEQADNDLPQDPPVSPIAQRNVLIAFGVTIALWLAPGFLTITGLGDTTFAHGYRAALPAGVAALVGATLLFVLPVDWRSRRFTMKWDDAVRIDWGIVLLYGGGLAMADMSFSTGLAAWAGELLAPLMPSHSSLALTAVFTGSAILISEVAPKPASAIMTVSLAIAVSQVVGASPVAPALGATLGASMGYVMPVSSASNALVYSSGYVPVYVLARRGLLMDVAAFAVIVPAAVWLGPLLAS
jgi:solute carrier family 13 (sodium-dependent dicarboxylate transporter), member 2/3/5